MPNQTPSSPATNGPVSPSRTPLAKSSALRATKPLRDIALDVYAGLNSTDAAMQAQVVADYFDNESTFADPLVVASSTSLIKGVFAGNLLAFSSIEKRVLSITESSDLPVADTHVVCIDADVVYRLRWLPLSFTVRTVSKITLNKMTGIVVHYEDIWSLMDLIEEVPLFGTLYSKAVRPVVGAATQLLVKMLVRPKHD